MPYRVKKAFEGFKELTTVVDGKRVALVAEYERETTATATRPPEKIRVPLATQAEMKKIFERGDPCVEEYDEKPFFEHEAKNPFKGVTEETLNKEQEILPKKGIKDKKHEP